MVGVLLAEVAEVSRAVAGASGRLAKVAAIAAALTSAGPEEVPIVVAYLSGELPQRQIGVGWAALRSAPSASASPSLTVLGVDASFSEIGALVGPGSVAERKRLVDEVLSAATAEEQYFLVRLLSGELRQGALDGVMTEAVARASEVPAVLVRRAVMLRGSLPAVAEAALAGGADALSAFGLLVGQPLKPMLASSAPSVEAALDKIAADAAKASGAGKGKGDGGRAEQTARTPAAVEWKLDGIRVQAHLSGGNVRLFTRTLDDITPRLPEVVAALTALPLRTAVFDGELIALRPDGRPYAFQDTASRAASQIGAGGQAGAGGDGGADAGGDGGAGAGGGGRAGAGGDGGAGAGGGGGAGAGGGGGAGAGGGGGAGAGDGDPAVPLSAFLFDVLHLDGADLIDLPDAERRAALAGAVPAGMLMPRLVTADVEEAHAFFRDAVARGHEGVVVKSLATPYAAGRRGAGWIKVKPRHTLDLVVLAVEWGHGRRDGWLSNLHLGARDPDTGGWVMLGKTFKGLTDELLTWQTARLLELEDHRDEWTVYVRPELVVEIAFDGVQRSPRYPGGVALRFARVLRYREDKPAAEADTIASVRDLAVD